MAVARPVPLPKEVRVGPFAFTVDWSVAGWSEALDATIAGTDHDAQNAYGMTDRRGCAIWINPHAAAGFQREALLHEVMHACQFTAGLPNMGPVTGEDFITRVSPLLLDALDRSPGLRAYLFP